MLKLKDGGVVLFFFLAVVPLFLGGVSPIWEALSVSIVALVIVSGAAGSIRWPVNSNTSELRVTQHAPVSVSMMFLLLIFLIFNGSSVFNIAYLFSHLLLFLYCGFLGRKSVRNIIEYMPIVVACYCLYGLFAFYSLDGSVLWFGKWTSYEAVTSTFVNKNNFASFGALGALLATRNITVFAENLGFRKGVFKGDAAFLIQKLPFALVQLSALAIIVYSVLLSQSKGGVGALLIGWLVFFLLKVRFWARGMLFKIKVIGACFLSAGALLYVANWNGFSSVLERIKIYQIILAAIRDNLLFGYGLGGFAGAFSKNRDAGFGADVRVLHGHNEYLELLLELGVVGVVLLAATTFSLYLLLLEIRSSATGNGVKSGGALAWSCLCAMAFHSLMDFPMQIAAISYFFVVVFGCCTDCSWYVFRYTKGARQ